MNLLDWDGGLMFFVMVFVVFVMVGVHVVFGYTIRVIEVDIVIFVMPVLEF